MHASAALLLFQTKIDTLTTKQRKRLFARTTLTNLFETKHFELQDVVKRAHKTACDLFEVESDAPDRERKRLIETQVLSTFGAHKLKEMDCDVNQVSFKGNMMLMQDVSRWSLFVDIDASVFPSTRLDPLKWYPRGKFGNIY